MTKCNTWFPDRRKKVAVSYKSNRTHFVKKENYFDSKVSFVNTLIRALRNERNTNNRKVLVLHDTYCLLCSVFGLCD